MTCLKMSASAVSPTPNNPSRPFALAIVVTIASAALLIGGCAARQGVLLPEITSWESRTAVLGSRQEWEFSGRIAVRANDDGFNGKLRWAQDADTFMATVSGPLGIGTVRIEGNRTTATLTDKDGVRTELRNVEAELWYRYGWTIPVASLRYWALGIPDPVAAADTEFDADGRLGRLSQRDWTVDITRYRESAGQWLPNRLTASNADTRVRIVIDNWLFFD